MTSQTPTSRRIVGQCLVEAQHEGLQLSFSSTAHLRCQQKSILQNGNDFSRAYLEAV